MAKHDDGKPYGFVLVLRGIARAAIRLKDYPASLRVLCVMADYMNAEGVCTVGQDTVAARLGVSRQAINKHIRILHDMEIICSSTRVGRELHGKISGRASRYVLDTEGLENERAGQHWVEHRRRGKERVAEGLFSPRMRPGYRAYEKALKAGADARVADAAMAAEEERQGLRFELVEQHVSGERWYRKVQLLEVA